MKIIMALSILLLSLTGCSNDSIFQGMANDSGSKATLEDAAIALDDQDYDKVISTLIEIYDTTNPDPEVSRMLGSAYMGKAGIDVTNLITYSTYSQDIDSPYFEMVANSLILALTPPSADTSINNADCSVQDLTVLMTTDGGQYINGHCSGGVIDYLNKAKRTFYLLHQAGKQTTNDTIQYGIVSAVHFVMILGNATANSLNSTLIYGPEQAVPKPDLYKPDTVPVPINKKAYNLLRYHKPWFVLNYVTKWPEVKTHTFFKYDYSPQLNAYKEDLFNIDNALTAFDSVITNQNSVRDELDNFLRDILQNPEEDITDSISTMTTQGLFDYIEILSAQ